MARAERRTKAGLKTENRLGFLLLSLVVWESHLCSHKGNNRTAETARVINMFILFNPGNLNLEIHPKKISQWQKKKKKKLKKNP